MAGRAEGTEGSRKVMICPFHGKHSSYAADVSHRWTGVVIHNGGTFEEEGVCVRAEKIDSGRRERP